MSRNTIEPGGEKKGGQGSGVQLLEADKRIGLLGAPGAKLPGGFLRSMLGEDENRHETEEKNGQLLSGKKGLVRRVNEPSSSHHQLPCKLFLPSS